jgi:hypothetical protein
MQVILQSSFEKLEQNLMKACINTIFKKGQHQTFPCDYCDKKDYFCSIHHLTR